MGGSHDYCFGGWGWGLEEWVLIVVMVPLVVGGPEAIMVCTIGCSHGAICCQGATCCSHGYSSRCHYS